MLQHLRNATVVSLILATLGFAADWPQWGRDATKNMVAPEAKNIPAFWVAGEQEPDSEQIDMSTTTNVKWVAKLGSESYGNPAVANGRVYVGTNNDSTGDDRFKGDFSILLCLDENTGQVLWKLTVPKLGSAKVGDWEYLGICSAPAVDGDRVYIVTNRCEVMCLDVHGMANGNQGFQDEAQYFIGPGQPKVELTSTDADILWIYDMSEELGVFPHNVTSSGPLVVGDKVWVSTSNGVDWSHINIPNVLAPTFVCLDKMTGKLMGEEAQNISENILHGGWSSPAFGEVDGRGLIFFTGPDGVMYAFDQNKFSEDADGFQLMTLAWKYDGNPPGYRWRVKDPTWVRLGPGQWKMKDDTFELDKNGEKIPIRYVRPDGPSEYIASPVFHNGRIYAAIGQDPEHGEGVGSMACVDARTGEQIWHYPLIHRAIATCAIADGRVYVADYSGYIYCFDADNGELHWRHYTWDHIWASPLVADGKLITGTDGGLVNVIMLDQMNTLAAAVQGPAYTEIKIVRKDGERFSHLLVRDQKQLDSEDRDAGEQLPVERTEQIIREIDMGSPVNSSAVVANDVLYIGTKTHLYAIEKKQ